MHFVRIAATLLFIAVATGAFGAHALKATLVANGRLDVWHTAVNYQMVHGIALLGIGIWRVVDARVVGSRLIAAAGWLWIAGIMLFSGSLYGISLDGPRWLGPITPVGGFCFLAGWGCLAFIRLRAAARSAKSP